MAKDYFKALNTPGPGEYQNVISIADLTKERSKKMSSTFVSSTGKAMKFNIHSSGGSPRSCAFAVPNSGEQYTNYGAVKGFTEDLQ